MLHENLVETGSVVLLKKLSLYFHDVFIISLLEEKGSDPSVKKT